MGKTFLNLLGIMTVIALFSGCVVIINTGEPTKEEQTLMDIQSQASRQIAEINQKIQAGGFSVEQIQDLIREGKKVLDENLQKIEELQLPERARELTEKTKEYLVKARQTYEAFLQMSSQADQKVQELVANLKNMSQPLINMAQQIEEMKMRFLDELEKAASATQQP